MFGHWSDTGFGVVTQQLSMRFLAAGEDVRVIAVNHRGEPLKGPMASRVWPAQIKGDPTGGNISQEATIGKFWQEYDRDDFWVPDAVLMVGDAGFLQSYIGKHRELFPDRIGPFGSLVPTWNYVPIEGDSINRSWKEIWARIKPVAMSRFGQQQISELVGYEVPMIYHGVDIDTFYPAAPNHPIHVGPLTIIGKRDAKEKAGYDPDRLMILRTDRLVERKQYNVLLQAMLPVFKAHPEVDLVIHTHPLQPPLNLYEEVGRYIPEQYQPQIRLTGAHDTYNGLPPAALCALYNAADIYVSPTAGEGFGLTLAEAAACEVPIVTTDYAAGPEVMAPGGITVPPLHDTYGNVVKIHSTYGMDWAHPDPYLTTEAIMRLLDKPSLRRSLGKAGRMHVRQLNWDISAAQFIELFKQGHLEWLATMNPAEAVPA